eukprot:g1577.t1
MKRRDGYKMRSGDSAFVDKEAEYAKMLNELRPKAIEADARTATVGSDVQNCLRASGCNQRMEMHRLIHGFHDMAMRFLVRKEQSWRKAELDRQAVGAELEALKNSPLRSQSKASNKGNKDVFPSRSRAARDPSNVVLLAQLERCREQLLDSERSLRDVQAENFELREQLAAIQAVGAGYGSILSPTSSKDVRWMPPAEPEVSDTKDSVAQFLEKLGCTSSNPLDRLERAQSKLEAWANSHHPKPDPVLAGLVDYQNMDLPNFVEEPDPATTAVAVAVPEQEETEAVEETEGFSYVRSAKNKRKSVKGGGRQTFSMKDKVQDIFAAQMSTRDKYKKSGVAQKIVRSTHFENLCMFVLAYADAPFVVVENLFCCFFFFEILVRLLAFDRTWGAFKDRWFLFDFALVVLMVTETWIMFLIVRISTDPTQTQEQAFDSSVLRLLKLVRITRVARIARLLRQPHSLGPPRRIRGRGVRAGAAAARIQRAWKKRKSSRPEVRPEEALPPPVKRLAPQHWAASRIQRAWKISRWRRVFIVDCKRDLGWLGSLDWLQRHNMLYGTELAETEETASTASTACGSALWRNRARPWTMRSRLAWETQTVLDVDQRLYRLPVDFMSRLFLARMWFGGEEPPPEPPARPAPGPAGPAPRAAATNPAVPVARPAPKRASLGGYSGAGRVVPTLRLGQARSLAAPVAVPRPVGTAISPRVEGRQLLSASAATLHRCASPTLIRTHRPGLSAAAPVHVGEAQERKRSTIKMEKEMEKVPRSGQKPTTLEFLGLAGNFGHLNLKDPFDVKKRGSSYATEVRAGITTFLAMAYILPVNSGMLSLVIPDKREQLVCATAIAAFCGCWLMGILSNYPFMLAPGMGTNAFFTFTICLGRGARFTKINRNHGQKKPFFFQESIGAGVGLFLCFIAFQSSEGMGLSVADPATLVTLNSLSLNNYDAYKLWLSLAVLGLTATLFAAKVPGAPLIGIIFGTAGLSGALWDGFGAAVHADTAATFWTAVGTFCYTDLLDSSGTFFAVAKVAGLTDRRGNLPLARQMLGLGR